MGTCGAVAHWACSGKGPELSSDQGALTGRGRPRGIRLLLTAGLALTLVGSGQFSSCSRKGAGADPQKAPPRAVPVAIATAVSKTVPVDLTTFGTVQALSTVTVRCHVGGYLDKVHFKEGQLVKEGDPLVSIDPRSFAAALKQAEENLARDAAQAKDAEADAARDADLLKKKIISGSDYDKSRAAADALAAAVRADTAAIEAAKVQLGYCTLRSPVTGRVGALLLNQGNLVKADDAAIVVVNQTTPIYVTFSLPQQHLHAIREYQGKAGPLKVKAIVPGDPEPEEGTLTFINNTVDIATGMIQLRGTFPNPDEHLWPGHYVNVVLTLTQEEGAVVVPSQAIQTSQAGQFVFVVKPDLTVEDRPVVVSRTVGDEAVVAKGMKAGERVVTDGQLLLVAGTKVEIKSETPGTQGGKP